METIKNYLEAMFRNLPQTEKVLRAKSELFQMMEDKYTELIREGKTENEAVGTVISEFGNLEDLADDLGIKDIIVTSRNEQINRRKVTFDEIKKYLEAKRISAYMNATAIMLCICCPVGPIFFFFFLKNDTFGVICLFLILAVAIMFFIMASSRLEDFKFLQQEACTLDAIGKDYIINAKREYTSSYSVRLSIGVLLCVLCVLPSSIVHSTGPLEDLADALLFIFVGAGVFLIVSSNKIKHSYEKLLNLEKETVFKEKDMETQYSNKKLKAIMSAYWPTVTCIYLCVSFITAEWAYTWLIWPIAAALSAILKAVFTTSEEQ